MNFKWDIDDVIRMRDSEELVKKQKKERVKHDNKVDQWMSWYDPEVPKEWLQPAYKLYIEGKQVLFYR